MTGKLSRIHARKREPARTTPCTGRMARLLALLLLWGTPMFTAAAGAQVRPQRIVSTNMCTDQLLMRLVEPERIMSMVWLSWEKDATPPEFQPVLARAKPNHGLAEEVLMMEPDLVVTGTFSARFTTELLRKLGRKVVLLTPENNFEDYYANIRAMGEAVGEPARAEKLIADFQMRLAALQAQIPPGEMPVYADIGVNFWVAGKDTLYTHVVNAGGFRTLGEAAGITGYGGIPLEQLVQMKVDLISISSADDKSPSIQTESLHHPLLRKMAREIPRLDIPARYTTCPTPETLDAIAMLVEARKQIDAKKVPTQAGAG